MTIILFSSLENAGKTSSYQTNIWMEISQWLRYSQFVRVKNVFLVTSIFHFEPQRDTPIINFNTVTKKSKFLVKKSEE